MYFQLCSLCLAGMLISNADSLVWALLNAAVLTPRRLHNLVLHLNNVWFGTKIFGSLSQVPGTELSELLECTDRLSSPALTTTINANEVT